MTEAGGLPVLLHVVHYVPLEELASPPEVPTVGVVVGVLHAGGGDELRPGYYGRGCPNGRR